MSIEQGWEDADQQQDQGAPTWFPEPIPVKVMATETENVAPEATSWNTFSIAAAPGIAGTGGSQPTQLCPHRYHRYKAKFICNIPEGTTVYLSRVQDYLMSNALANMFSLSPGQQLPDYDGQQALYAVYTGTPTGSANNPVTAEALIAAGGGTNTATLPVGADITGFDITSATPTASGGITTTVNGAQGGTLTYYSTGEGTAVQAVPVRFPTPLVPAVAGTPISVTSTSTSTQGAVSIVVYGNGGASVPSISVMDEGYKEVQ